MPDLSVCIDPGASQTKIIYQLEKDNLPKHLLMEPYVESVSRPTLDFYFASTGWTGFPAPSIQAWVEINQQIFVVGAFARLFDAEDRLRELKYENALYKVLAAIGVIVQRHNLNLQRKLSIELAVLLPANEYNDRQRFQEKLASIISNFSFRGIQIKGKINRFLCRPEGSGLAAIVISRNGINWFQANKLGILMLGHRNVSGLYFEHGNIKTYDSPLLGFWQLLDSVVNLTSGLTREQIASAISESLFQAGNKIYISRANDFLEKSISYTEHPNWIEYSSIKNLASANDENLRQKEIESIIDALNIATKQYWSKLSKWINKLFVQDLDTVIIAGGGASFLEPELEDYFNCEPMHGYDSSLGERKDQCYFKSGEYKKREANNHFTPIIWGAGLHQELETLFNFVDNRQSLGYRLIDGFGLFEQLLNKNCLSEKSFISKEEVEIG